MIMQARRFRLTNLAKTPSSPSDQGGAVTNLKAAQLVAELKSMLASERPFEGLQRNHLVYLTKEPTTDLRSVDALRYLGLRVSVVTVQPLTDFPDLSQNDIAAVVFGEVSELPELRRFIDKTLADTQIVKGFIDAAGLNGTLSIPPAPEGVNPNAYTVFFKGRNIAATSSAANGGIESLLKAVVVNSFKQAAQVAAKFTR
jgi:hypothetical protein